MWLEPGGAMHWQGSDEALAALTIAKHDLYCKTKQRENVMDDANDLYVPFVALGIAQGQYL